MEAPGNRKRVWWMAAVIVALLATLVGGAAYLLARNSGEDLDRARAKGDREGVRLGSRAGTERGLESGERAGEKRAFKPAYRRARARTIKGGAGTTAAAPVSRSCGDLVESGAGTYKVQSVNTVCDIATQVARQWEDQCASQPSGTCTVRAGFACTYVDAGIELGRITCTSGSRKVTFETGA